jgi:hypothetical protein
MYEGLKIEQLQQQQEEERRRMHVLTGRSRYALNVYIYICSYTHTRQASTRYVGPARSRTVAVIASGVLTVVGGSGPLGLPQGWPRG